MTDAFPSIPNFDVLTPLGAGGMGRVYLAKHRGAYGFEKLLAVKVIHPERDHHAGTRAMFLDEARLVAQLHHPAIAQVYDFGESEHALYLVMEYVPGVSIAQLLAEGVRLPPLICASIVAAVCRGLHAAHEAKDVQGRPLNVVHRDVTPTNLVLTFGGQVKILDFGIALTLHRSAPVTGVGQIRGKPTYLSPEQIEGEPIDRRTDIYSLSIVLHEILTGLKLFSLDEFLSRPGTGKRWKEISGTVQQPSKSAGPLPAGLDEIVMKGLEVDPADRFPDARAMAVALEAIVEREGCETLESFVERELLRYRERHEARMRNVLAGEPLVEPGEHPATQDDAGPPPEREDPTQPSVDPALRDPVRAEPRPGTGRMPREDRMSGAAGPPASARLRSLRAPLAPTAPGEPATVVARPALAAKERKRSRAAAILVAATLAALAASFLAFGSDPPAPAAAPDPVLRTPPKVVRAEPIVLPEPPPPIEPARTIEKPPEPIRRPPKKRQTTKKPTRKVVKPVPADGIITEW